MIVQLNSNRTKRQPLPRIVQGHSHGHVPFNNHARAASLASEHAANQERQCRNRPQRHQSRSNSSNNKPKRKKTMEEGIRNAKRFPKVVLDEIVESESGSENEVMNLPNEVVSDLSEEEDGDENLLWGITSGFEQETHHDEIGTDGHPRQRKKKRRRRKQKTRYSGHTEDRPSSSPSMAPTAMPTATTSEDVSLDEPDMTPSATDTPTTTLVGTTLLDKFYIANQVRVGSAKSELFQCYHLSDLPSKSHPLMMKLSRNLPQMQLEHKIYNELYAKLTPSQKDLFVQVFDWIPASDHTDQRVGFVMEAGLENLRGIVWRYGAMTGDVLRQAMLSLIQSIQALHQLGTVWTEVKAENFIVMADGKIKAIDLESVAAHGEFLRCYSVESYPPEFPPDSLYKEIPQIPLDYSFDIWGLGLILVEMAIGEPLFTLQKTYDVDYVRERLKDAQGIVDEAKKRLDIVDPQAREVILQCLVVDPAHRSTCEQLLQHRYFHE